MIITAKVEPFTGNVAARLKIEIRKLKALAIKDDMYIKQDGDCTFHECAGVYEEETVNVGEFDEYRPAKALVCDECGDTQLLEPESDCGAFHDCETAH